MIRQEIGDIAGMAATLHNMGSIIYGRKAYEEAIPYFLKAYAILKQIGSPNLQHPESYLDAIKEKLGEARYQEIPPK
ncbi:MAG: tetratricopeptide repeat protein [Bacteroidetes bacterium]|nr:tetratricopeptide repeat protein [Bacteroidota bacterium]